MTAGALTIADIAIDTISVLNPRRLSRRALQHLSESIAKVGLKRPITVAPRPDGGFHLVCGQGRLEACRALGARFIAAICVEADPTDCILMGLVENIVRAQRSTPQAIGELVALHERGWSSAEIASATGLTPSVIDGMLDRGRSTVNATRREERSRMQASGYLKQATSPQHAVHAVSDQPQHLVRLAERAEAHLGSIVEGLNGLVADSELLDLLQAEAMQHVPRSLLDRLARRREWE